MGLDLALTLGSNRGSHFPDDPCFYSCAVGSQKHHLRGS